MVNDTSSYANKTFAGGRLVAGTDVCVGIGVWVKVDVGISVAVSIGIGSLVAVCVGIGSSVAVGIVTGASVGEIVDVSSTRSLTAVMGAGLSVGIAVAVF